MSHNRSQIDRILHGNERGPSQGEGNNGKGAGYRGLIEETPAIRIGWIVWACKLYGIAVEPIANGISFCGQGLSCERIKSGFGYRYYWICPRCGKRTSIVFALRQGPNYAVGCKRRECLHLGYLSQTTKPNSVYRTLHELLGRPNSKYDIPVEVQGYLKEVLKPFARLHALEIVDNLEVDTMEVKRMIHQSQMIKSCRDKRVSILFDYFDKWLKEGHSPREAWQAAIENYAEEFFYVKK